jgi:uncharacterized protein YpmB
MQSKLIPTLLVIIIALLGAILYVINPEYEEKLRAQREAEAVLQYWEDQEEIRVERRRVQEEIRDLLPPLPE